MKNKTLLVNLGFFHASTVLPPMGLAYLAGVLEEYKQSVTILDANALQLTETQVIAHIRKEKPDIIGIYLPTPSVNDANSLIKRIKKLKNKSLVVLGGPHPSVLPKESLLTTGADLAVKGEGEFVLLEIVQKYNGTLSSVDNIRGTTLRRGRAIYDYGRAAFIKDLNKIPYPARHLLPNHLYSTPGVTETPFATILTSRGCPGQCIYCNKAIFGFDFRPRSVANVMGEIKLLVEKYHIKELDFLDDTFTCDPKRAIKICQAIIRSGYTFRWRCSNGIRVDTASLKLLRLMKKAGCYQVAFGVESGDNRMLESIGKGTNTRMIRKAMAIAKEASLETVGFFIIGLPKDTKATMLKTIRFAKELDLDFAQFTMMTPLPGTRLYAQLQQEIGFTVKNWAEYDFFSPHAHFGTDNFTKEDVEKMYKFAYRSFYLRPKYLLKRITSIRSTEDLAFKLRAAKSVLGNALSKE